MANSYLVEGNHQTIDPRSQPANKGFRLLTPGELNPKTKKGQKLNYDTYILHLSPGDRSGTEMCTWRSSGCTDGCLNTAGAGGMYKNIQAARYRKTAWFNSDRGSFMASLMADVSRAIKRAHSKGMTPAFRLNGTSDVLWERIPVGDQANIMEAFPEVQFYDYTKAPARLRANRPSNYHLTFSLGEHNERQAIAALEDDMNVAVVFRRKPYPDAYLGAPVVDGDDHDLRFLDPLGTVVALKAKGKAKLDQTGFVKDVEVGELVEV